MAVVWTGPIVRTSDLVGKVGCSKEKFPKGCVTTVKVVMEHTSHHPENAFALAKERATHYQNPPLSFPISILESLIAITSL